METDRRAVLKAALASVVAGSAVGLSPAATAQDRAWARRKKKARVRGLSLAYVEMGQGQPIVFLHGNPTSSYLWRNVMPHVQHLGRCIAPDMIGMGDSDPLPDSGPGRYTFRTHRDYLFGLFEALKIEDDVTFVIHDWGSGVGLSWAQMHTDRVKGIAYMEAILRPPAAPPAPEPTRGPFAVFRSPAGEKAVLEDNLFVEQLLIAGLSYYLTDADKAEYRRPYLTPGESRRPTLEWPRELPLAGGPAETEELVRSYTAWLERDEQVPKLFVHAAPGAILGNPQILEYVRAFKNQREVTVYGSHYVQEISGAAIGRALAEWIPSLA